MARLAAGFLMDAVIQADDGEIVGHHRRHGGQRADIHQQFAVAGDHRDLRFGRRQRDPEPHGHRRAHGATHVQQIVAFIGQGAGVPRRAGQTGQDRESLILDTVTVAVRAGVDLNASDAADQTALAFAKARRYDSVVAFLLTAGARE